MFSVAPDTISDSTSMVEVPEVHIADVDDHDDEEDREAGKIPFCTIHNIPSPFKSPHRNIFITNKDIQVKILSYERNATSYILNPHLYTIELTHGDFIWTVKKRYKHFQNLHQQLKLHTVAVNLPLPTKAHRERKASLKSKLSTWSSDKTGKSTAMPKLPKKHEAMVSKEDMSIRIEQLQDYLNNILKIKLYRNYYETANFLEVSHLSFVKDLGEKGKEGLIQKRTGSTRPGQGTVNLCGLLNSTLCIRCKYFYSHIGDKWLNRWLFVKDTYMGYVRPKDGCIKSVLLFDSGFEISSGTYATSMHNGLQITNLSRQLIIKCWTRRKKKEWMTYLKDVVNKQAKDFTQKNRYNSFAPNREAMHAVWFVDGCTYMAAVADALETAKEEIYIADWWLSPEIFMKRPTSGDTWRLDTILKRKANEGVKIFVLLYKEVKFALGINSNYSKQHLAYAHKNIKVLRHPDHAKSGVIFWAHHEKVVVIDQTYAFLGGFDLCYGRWDDYNHRLTDVGTASQTLGLPSHPKQTSSRHMSESNYPCSFLHLAVATNMISVGTLGGSSPCLYDDFSLHQGLKVVSQPISSSMCSLPASETPMVTEVVNISTSGLPPNSNTLDTAPPSICASQIPLINNDHNSKNRRQNSVNKLSDESEKREHGKKKWLYKLFQKGDYDSSDEEVQDMVNVAVHIQEPDEDYDDKEVKNTHCMKASAHLSEGENARNHNSLENNTAEKTKLWIGKDYTNFIVKDFGNLDSPYQDSINRDTTPRMPWHDIGVMVQGAAGRDVARHFIERWNAVKLEKFKFNSSYPYLLPKSYINLDKVKPILLTPVRSVDCQVVRSIAQWSGGYLEPDTLEAGIHEAYEDIITNAKHYIYIENQFFITLSCTSSEVHNQIGNALFKRILRAYNEKAVFRVYVIMPLLPGFEGEVGTARGRAINAITHWNYSSICRGKEAILNRLVDAGVPDPMEYISFYGLRTHSSLHGELISELIYVHSKLLIADDNIVICGSANINDRSLLGKRDSEIAVVLKDREFEEGVMNGSPVESGKFAGSLRRYLFEEHLGLLTSCATHSIEVNIEDPICASFYHDTWRKIATLNTCIYDEVFNCLPNDKASSFQKVKELQQAIPLSISDPIAAAKLLSGVQGHLVCLPLQFLKTEQLTPEVTTVEGIMPTELWT